MMVTHGVRRKDKMEYEVLKRCFIINYEQGKHEYRIKKGPHIICADPLCHRIFSSDEEYIEHIDAIMNLRDKSQLPRGVEGRRLPNGGSRRSGGRGDVRRRG